MSAFLNDIQNVPKNLSLCKKKRKDTSPKYLFPTGGNIKGKRSANKSITF